MAQLWQVVGATQLSITGCHDDIRQLIDAMSCHLSKDPCTALSKHLTVSWHLDTLVPALSIEKLFTSGSAA